MWSTLGTAVGTLVVASLMNAPGVVLLGLLALVLAGSIAWLVWTRRTQIAADAQIVTRTTPGDPPQSSGAPAP